jgi:hypothetical protein
MKNFGGIAEIFSAQLGELREISPERFEGRIKEFKAKIEADIEAEKRRGVLAIKRVCQTDDGGEYGYIITVKKSNFSHARGMHRKDIKIRHALEGRDVDNDGFSQAELREMLAWDLSRDI